MPERSHLSIGEVLNLLQDEFPDITISKIRFLESQGLLDPERTPSGYRKFYETDIERLRWILRQQRENFLPLKVIKDRLASGDLQDPPPPAVEASDSGPSTLDVGQTSVSLSLDELASASGLGVRVIGDLERFGLLTSRSLGSTSYYDEDALVIARLAAGFIAHGVEPRHLRMYKVAAEREAGVFEQLVMPILKQRSPAGRQQAIDTLCRLAGLGDQLRSAMLRQSLREYLGAG